MGKGLSKRTVGYCRDCKWWSETAHSDWHQCDLTETDGFDGKNSESLAVVEPTYEYHLALLTKPDFGCVQFEKSKRKGQDNGKEK